MSQGPFNEALDALTEETAQQIIFTSQPGTSRDPLPAVKQQLYDYLERAQELLAEDALRQQADEERAQQN